LNFHFLLHVVLDPPQAAFAFSVLGRHNEWNQVGPIEEVAMGPLRLVLRTLYVLTAALMLASSISADPAVLWGTLTTPPIPAGYKIVDTFLLVRDGQFLIEVDARGECKITIRPVELPGRDGTSRSIPLPRRECKEAVAVYGLPSGLVVEGPKVYHRSTSTKTFVGDLAGLPSVKWVKLRGASRIEATSAEAVLLIGGAKKPARRPEPARTDPLERLFPSPGSGASPPTAPADRR
jgi:hypothetical protein